MTPKERAAIQQALEALEELFHSNSTKVAVEKYNTAHNALLEALEQPNEIDWIETNKALANEIIELKKQAEQEPDYFGLTHDHTWLSIEKKQYDKLKPEGRMACYAAPVSIALQSETDSSSSSMRTTVHTKDLTDGEIWEIIETHPTDIIKAIRAVISADRGKNK